MLLEAELSETVDPYDVIWASRAPTICAARGETFTISAGRGAIICPQERFSLRLGEAYEQLHIRIERSTVR